MACCSQILPNPPPNGTINLPYSVNITATDAFGGPCTGDISLTGGTLPDGIIFTITDEGPKLMGIPTQSGTFNLIFQITHKGCPTINDIHLTLIINNIEPANKKKKRNQGFIVTCPDEIIFRSEARTMKVQYCGSVYNFYGIDNNGMLHYINAGSNIAERGKEKWSVKTF